MKYILEFINEYGLSLVHSILISIISYTTIVIKRIIKKHLNDKTKKEVITMVAHAVNELYPNESGKNKLNIAINNAKEILNKKGINISDLELRIYIVGTISIIKNNLEIHKNIDK